MIIPVGKDAVKGIMVMMLQPLQLTDSTDGVIFSNDKDLKYHWVLYDCRTLHFLKDGMLKMNADRIWFLHSYFDYPPISLLASRKRCHAEEFCSLVFEVIFLTEFYGSSSKVYMQTLLSICFIVIRNCQNLKSEI